MLVLSRRPGECIELSGGTILTVLAIRSRKPAAVLDIGRGPRLVDEGSSLRLGDIRLLVSEVVHAGQVRIGIEAPPEVYVYRSEVIDKIIEPFSHYSPEFIAARTRIPLEMVERRVTCTNTKD